ncbi:MAG TPA: hypothetical protein VIK65_01040 [Candidatus Limnocylindrales bacterium]
MADDNAIVARRWASSAPRIAAEAAASADLNATVTEEIAQLAEQVASSATAAAARARLAADDAKKAARVNREGHSPRQMSRSKATRAFEVAARNAYHEAEVNARRRSDGSG